MLSGVEGDQGSGVQRLLLIPGKCWRKWKRERERREKKKKSLFDVRSTARRERETKREERKISAAASKPKRAAL